VSSHLHGNVIPTLANSNSSRFALDVVLLVAGVVVLEWDAQEVADWVASLEPALRDYSSTFLHHVRF
jgi:hypothetical protein